MKQIKYKKRIYLDLCALERPYDDQSYPRIEGETAAVTLIMAKVKADEYVLTYSPVHESELLPNSDYVMNMEIKKLLQSCGENVATLVAFSKVECRGIALFDLGFGIADAMHVAYAEAIRAEFITCDDELLQKCRHHDVIIWYGTPVDFVMKEGLL